jgi:CYTH domain-containing protein
MPPHKYARIERERRFLVSEFPAGAHVEKVRHITDRYIDGTRLRLREVLEDGGPTVFKLTQKIPMPGEGAQQGLITNLYLSEGEWAVLSKLPAKRLVKTRHSVPPFGVDVFEDRLAGLILAEAEFDSADDTDALVVPSFLTREVSTDVRFTGGQLANASRAELEMWLAEYGIRIEPNG